MLNTKYRESNLFAKGADVSWLPQMEAAGYVFYNDEHIQQDCLDILKDHGMDSIRLRVWVNPSEDPGSGHCSVQETVEMAVRCKSNGFRIMIDFHYSDTWADPAKQGKPAAWVGHDFGQLKRDVYEHTLETMKALKEKDIFPEWVQVGNEIPGGMLWPDGSTENFDQLAQLINAGFDAVKEVSPDSKVIVHLDQGNDRSRFVDFFDRLTAWEGKYDVIGMSYYPYWINSDYTETIDRLGQNMIELTLRYNKEVMVCEVGGEYSEAENTYDMLKAVLEKVRAVPEGKGLGVFYWEPQGATSWSNYRLCAWGDDGSPTKAMDAFLA